jgi:hypothetical protein
MIFVEKPLIALCALLACVFIPRDCRQDRHQPREVVLILSLCHAGLWQLEKRGTSDREVERSTTAISCPYSKNYSRTIETRERWAYWLVAVDR